MIQICSLRSGSSGNAILVFTEKTKILVDCGISGKSIAACLTDIGISCDDIDAILITHEHSDHTNSAGVMCRRHHIPIYANSNTWSAMHDNLGSINDNYIKFIDKETAFEIGDIGICGFSVPHDAADPMGYSFFSEEYKISIATDTGHVSQEVFDNIKGSDVVLLEANHDLNMLEIGSYPLHLKRRIKSDRGHLSNEAAAKLAVMLVEFGTQQILLGHLSKENNIPYLAYEAVNMELKSNGIKVNSDIGLDVAARSSTGKIYKAGGTNSSWDERLAL